MKKLFVSILNFFRSIFKKKQPIPESISVPEPFPEPISLKLSWPKKDWRTPAETRSLLKQLRPGVLLFNKFGEAFAIYKILYRRKIGIFVEAESGQRWKIHFMGLQSKAFSPDLP